MQNTLLDYYLISFYYKKEIDNYVVQRTIHGQGEVKFGKVTYSSRGIFSNTTFTLTLLRSFKYPLERNFYAIDGTCILYIV